MNIHLRELAIAQSFVLSLGCLFLFGSCREQEELFYSMEDFPNVPKVDVHVHINTSNPALVEQAEADNVFLLTINVDVPDYPSIAQQQAYVVSLKSRFPKRLYFLSTFGTDDILHANWQQSAIDSLKIAQEKGSVGVKVWKNI